jgi:ribosomal protein L12E/L44/L45/RPP1/RPP2
MKNQDTKSINELDFKMGQEMDSITFSELVRELTGASFDEVFKGFNKDKKDDQSDLE